MANSETLSGLVLQLYRAAKEQPPTGFHDAALEILKAHLAFDSCTWGIGSLSAQGLSVHSAHLYREMPARYVGYDELKHGDSVAFQTVARPGRTLNFHLPTLFGNRSKRALREYTMRVRHLNELVTTHAEGAGRPVQWIALFRGRTDEQFSERERELCEFAVPHLLQALATNRRLRVADYSTASRAQRACALADYAGALHYSDGAFAELIRRELPDSAGDRLPPPLVVALNQRATGGYPGRRVRALFTRWDDLSLVRLYEMRPVDRLSAREIQIARLIAAGQSHKEIARWLGLSPATVRNHTQRIHERLGVRNNAELAAELHRT